MQTEEAKKEYREARLIPAEPGSKKVACAVQYAHYQSAICMHWWDSTVYKQHASMDQDADRKLQYAFWLEKFMVSWLRRAQTERNETSKVTKTAMILRCSDLVPQSVHLLIPIISPRRLHSYGLPPLLHQVSFWPCHLHPNLDCPQTNWRQRLLWKRH